MSGAAEEKLVVLIEAREKLFLSAARDLISFGGLIATAYVLNVMMPPSGWLNAALAIAWILWLAGKGAARKHRMTLPELRTWLEAQPRGEA